MFSLGFLKGVLDPLTHNNADFIISIDKRVLNQVITAE